ncbi:dual serine/threonine and tyrosine protein kinase-like, partial [Plakobranchus ocellatus]
MSSPSLTSELSKFCSYANRLKQIFAETSKCFNDINISGRFDGNQIVSAELLKEEELAITSVIEYPPTFVIFGQTPYAKSRIVNELFNKDVFPSLEEDSEIKLRMVRFYHGDKNTVSLTLPDDFDLVDNLEVYNGPWVTLPQSDLEIPDKGSADEASGLAVMEVTQNHPLLRYGVQVVVSPSHRPEQYEEVVNKCIEYATPVLIYGFTTDRLLEQDVVELHQLSRLTNMEPILFVRVPPPGSRTVDTDPPDGAPRGPYAHMTPSASMGLHHNTLLMPSSSPSTIAYAEDGSRDGGDGTRGVGYPSAAGCGNSNCPMSLGMASLNIESLHHVRPLNANNSANINNKKIHKRNSKDTLASSDFSDDTYNMNTYPQHYHSACCVHEQLRRLGYIRAPDPNLPDPSASSTSPSSSSSSTPGAQRALSWQHLKRDHLSTDSHLLERFTDFQSRLARFSRRTLQAYLVNAATVLNNSHTRCLNMFILSAFDMARDMLITPRKLEFAREKEEELYKSLLGISVSKLDEIKELIATTIEVIGNCIVAEAGEFDFIGVDVSETGQVSSTREVQACTDQIREMVLGRLNHAVAGKLVSSVDILRDSYTGTLTRCLESLETLDKDNPEEAKTTDALKQ